MDPLGFWSMMRKKKVNACVSLMINFTLFLSSHQSRFLLLEHVSILSCAPWISISYQNSFLQAQLGAAQKLEFVHPRHSWTKRQSHLKKFGKCCQIVMNTCQSSTLFCTIQSISALNLKKKKKMYIYTHICIHIQKYVVLSRLGMEKLLHGEYSAFKMCTPSVANHRWFCLWINHMEWQHQACTATVHLLWLL